jgi:hypothetical protein
VSSDALGPGMPIDCATAREAMEIAAVEPGGLARLMASPLPDQAAPGGSTHVLAGEDVPAAAVAAHIDTCAECTAELARLRAIAALLGDAIAPTPPADLRARTLALVAQVGRERPEPVPTRRARRTRLAVGVLALAAVFVLAIGATALVAGSIARSDVAAERARTAALAATAESALALMADPSAIHIPMRDGAGAAVGMAVVVPRTYDATVVAVGLPEPPAGHEYACYIVLDGERILVGRMADGGAAYAWVGTIEALSGVAPGAVGGYGVLLVPAGSTSTEGTPVLSGSL